MSSNALVLAPFAEDALAALRGQLSVCYETWTETRRLYSPEELVVRLNEDGIAVLVVEADYLFDEVFRESPQLKFVGVCRSSLDHVDVRAATEHGVVVVNTPGRNAQAVAELAIGLMIALARGVPQLDGYVKGGRWTNPVEPYLCIRGAELSGKTLGIVGLGAVGRKVAALGRAFGMEVLAYDPYAGVPGTRKAGASLAELESLLERSDFVSLHAPGNSETEGLLDRERLSKLKKGAYVVNTAAHPIVDEEALADGLRSGQIAGAALDVHRTHPIHPNSPVMSLENVILTPHIGGATDGTVHRHSWAIVEELRRFLAGRRPRHIANPQVWGRRG